MIADLVTLPASGLPGETAISMIPSEQQTPLSEDIAIVQGGPAYRLGKHLGVVRSGEVPGISPNIPKQAFANFVIDRFHGDQPRFVVRPKVPFGV